MSRGRRIGLEDARAELARADAVFVELMRRGTLSVELFSPNTVDTQQPHAQDELYIVQSGTGTFVVDGARHAFGPGDVLFAASGVEHRFEDFTADLTVWVIFYGPEGGEAVDS